MGKASEGQYTGALEWLVSICSQGANEIHPADAAARGIGEGDTVVVENERGWCRLRAVVTDGVRPGVLASPKGRWARLDPLANGCEGRNINWTTPDALGDMAGQSTFHSNRVWIRKEEAE